MDSELKRAQRYRDEAKNIRALAEKEINDASRQALLIVAESYDRLLWGCLRRAEQSGLPSDQRL